MSELLEDIKDSIEIILVMGCLAALIISAIWVVILEKFAGIIVWTTIFSVFALQAGVCVVASCFGGFYDYGLEYNSTCILADYGANVSASDCCKDSCQGLDTATLPLGSDYTAAGCDPGAQQNTFEGVFWVFLVFSSVTFVMVCCLRKRIQLAIGIIKEAAMALQAMPLLVFWPIVPVLVNVIFTSFCLYGASYLYTLSDTKAETVTSDVVASTNDTEAMTMTSVIQEQEDFLMWFWLFGYFWTTQFISAVSMLVISSAVCSWYWCDDKTTLGHAPILGAIYRSFRYHLGTAAFGSLIIAIIKMVRAVLTYIQKKMHDAGADTGVMKVLFCIMQCCLWCFEKCMKFINKNAYIMCSMKGTSFCSSAYQAFMLIIGNIARVGTCGLISNFVLFIGKIFVVLATVFAAYFWVEDHKNKGEIESIAPPLVCIGFMSYCIAYIVLGVFDMSIDTILLCACEDEKLNSNAAGGLYASEDLSQHLNHCEQQAAKKDEKTPEKAPAAANAEGL
jgi:choline transporter-like protein 2/4/5